MNLTLRAGLTFLSTTLNQLARGVTAFLVTPILVAGLGAELYGAWAMIQQTAGYLALSDLRPMGALKFSLGLKQHDEDVEAKRREIGAALCVWALTLPILIGTGSLVVYYAPALIKIAPEHRTALRVAIATMVVLVALERVLSIPTIVLRAMNQDYRAMGVNAAMGVLGGVATVGAIWTGWSLVGVAAATLFGVVASSVPRFVLARRAFPWFGASKPTAGDVRRMAAMSGWLLLSVFSGLLLQASEVLLVGYTLGTRAAGVYAATGLLVRLSTEVTSQLLGSGLPGLAGLCGRGEWSRVAALRREMLLVAMAVGTLIGVAAILLNHSAMEIWLGTGMYGGHLTNVLMVAGALAGTIYRIDAAIADAVLEFKIKAVLMTVAGAAGIAAAAWCATPYGMAGVAFCMLLARTAVVLSLPLALRRGTDIHFGNPMLAAPKLAATAIAVLTVTTAAALWNDNATRSVALVTASIVAAPMVLWLIGLDSAERARIWHRCDRVRAHVTGRLNGLGSPGPAATHTL